VNPAAASARRLAFALALAPAAHPAHAQIFNVTGGASNLYNSSGLTVRAEQPGFRTDVSIGYADGLKLGGLAEKDLSPTTDLRAGDSVIPFVLPTDIFDRSHVLLRRGFGLSRHAGANAAGAYTFDAFAGGGAENYVIPYLSYATIDHSLGMLFYTRTLTPHLAASTYLISLGQTTAIQALAWRPRSDLSLGFSAGIGSNHPFGAASLDFERLDWGIKTSYTAQDGIFRRLSVDPTGSAEVIGLNALAWRTWSHFHCDASRDQYQSIAEFADQSEKGTVLEASAGTNFAHLELDARIFHTTAVGIERENTSYSASYSYRFTRSNYTLYNSGSGTPANAPSGSSAVITPADRSSLFTEYIRASRRLELSSTLDLDSGNRNYSFGGTFSSNRLDLSIGQQIYFIPFAATQQLRQVWVVSLHLHAFGNTSAELDSQLGADDKVHYTAFAGDYLYRDGALWHTTASPSFKAPPYLIEGCVRTRSGDPVPGAAILIGKEEVFTGPDGCFQFSPRRPGTYPITLALADFATPGRYAPTTTPPPPIQLSPSAPHTLLAIELNRLPNDTP
jgi:hypothetical protein